MAYGDVKQNFPKGTLKENELLRVNKRNQVVKFDGAAARKLLLEAK